MKTKIHTLSNSDALAEGSEEGQLARPNVKPLVKTDDGEEGRNLIRGHIKINENGCWIWQRAISSTGYGTAWCYGRLISSHRLSYESFIGPASHLWICHKCDVRACVNPEHLFLGTEADNLNDACRKGRRGKIPREKLEEVFKLIKEGVPFKEIASMFGIHRTAINYWNYKNRI